MSIDYQIVASGTEMGVFSGDNAAEAVAAYFGEAGYKAKASKNKKVKVEGVPEAAQVATIGADCQEFPFTSNNVDVYYQD